MSDEILLGLDVGTSGARAVAVAASGTVEADAAEDYELLRPRPGWTEQRPSDWWDASRRALSRVVAEVGGDRVVGIGLTGQMHGAVTLDAADRPLRPALLWNDQRTTAEAEEIAERVGPERLVAIAGNPALTGFQAPKLLWIRNHEPELWARIARVLLPKDYIRLALTGEAITDPSDASGTLLFDVGRRAWSDELIGALELPRGWFPSVAEGTERAGELRADVAAELGLPAGLPVAAGGGDNAAAAVGAGILAPGRISSSIGTSGVVFADQPRFAPDPSGRVHAFCHAVPDAWHLMAVTLSAGASLAWWRDGFAPGTDFDELTAAAARVGPGAGGLLFAPYLHGERSPHLDPHARGALVGLTADHGPAEVVRAIMEGVVLSLRDGLDVIRGLGVAADEVVAVGSGARSPLWRRLQADVLGLPVRRLAADQGAAFGAARLAAVASGLHPDLSATAAWARPTDEITEPDPVAAARYDELYAIHAGLYAATRDTTHALGAFADRRPARTPRVGPRPPA